MRILTICTLLLLAPLTAQNLDTLGGNNNCPAGSMRAKANQIRIDQSVFVLDFEMFLDVPSPETLTFFAYRHHSRNGDGTLDWTLPVPVQGGLGPAWYSSGPIALSLAAGNYYSIGVAWAGAITYCYSTSGGVISFGEWQRAHTLNNTLPPTLNFGGNDGARYYQRFTTVPVPSVVSVGTGCSTAPTAPRLVAGGFFAINATQNLELVDAAPSSIAAFALAAGPAIGTPIPLFGCNIWLDLSAFATQPTTTDSSGYSSLMLTLPNNVSLVGQIFTGQAIILGPSIDLSNAVEFQIG